MSEWRTRTSDPRIAQLIDVGAGLAPDVWSAAVRTQLERVEHASEDLSRHSQSGAKGEASEASRRLRYEGHFLVVAIQHVVKVQRVYLELTGDERLARARRRFDEAGPDAKTLRDVLEHMDEYAQGVGRRQRDGSVRVDAGLETTTLLNHTGRVTLRFGGLELDLGAAAQAVLELAAVADEVWSDHVGAAVRDWVGQPESA